MVICPLSVTEGWALETARFAPHLRVLRYVGNKEEREGFRQRVSGYVNVQAPAARVGSTSFNSKAPRKWASYLFSSFDFHLI